MPLLYSSLSTRRSTYPTWILLTSMPIPTVIKRSDVGHDLCQDLLSSSRAIAVPPIVNDIAESLPWLLWEAPFPLMVSYPTIAINLRYVCDFNNNAHINPDDAHYQLTMLAMKNIVLSFLPAQHDRAMMMLRFYLGDRWGHRISFAGFQHLLLDSYYYLINVSIYFFRSCILLFSLL